MKDLAYKWKRKSLTKQIYLFLFTLSIFWVMLGQFVHVAEVKQNKGKYKNLQD